MLLNSGTLLSEAKDSFSAIGGGTNLVSAASVSGHEECCASHDQRSASCRGAAEERQLSNPLPSP